ncbi:MAG TPA: Ku protein [Pyrinomonadaceae bacterium]|jgi:DNA end-binding protein Ku|nr:Ku protein [Pyrinomonadaceae bacterium]
MATRRTSKTSERSEANGEQSRPRPFWSGTLTFGLVSVPVNLFPANKTSRAPLRMLSPEGEPLARKYYSEKTERQLDADQMVRGYEIDKGKYVVVTDDELDRLAPEKSRDIDLKTFVPADSIPPVYFERGYFLTPAAGSEKAYKLLAETMEKEGKAGLATFVMRGKEYLVAIFAEHGILRAETMRFPDELRSPADVGLPTKTKVPPAMVRKFEKLISTKSKKQLSPRKLEDEQTERLLNLVKKKSGQRKNIVEVETEKRDEGKVIDLMSVLKKSLAGKG